MCASAVQFGAGNIGRGFLAQLFTESGLEVIFVDVAAETVEAINGRRSYPIHIVGDSPQTIQVENVRAIHGSDREAVADAIAGAAVVCTAVGAGALPHIAPVLAAGIAARRRAAGPPLNILLCENLHDAPSILRDLVSQHLPLDRRDPMLCDVGFVHAVVSRMVPVQTETDRAADSLAVRAEAYKRLPIDASAVVGVFPPIAGVEPTTRFAAYEERKLYTHNCAHAVLGYLGYLAGYVYGYEALQDTRIASLIGAALSETGAALVHKHGFAADEQRDYERDLLERFGNRALGDTCRRLARDPLRKLAPSDRLVGAARLCESQGVAVRALAWAILAALRFDDPSDPSAPEMQRMLTALGRDVAIERICGITAHEPLSVLLREAYETTVTGPAGAGL